MGSGKGLHKTKLSLSLPLECLCAPEVLSLLPGCEQVVQLMSIAKCLSENAVKGVLLCCYPA